MALLSLKVRIVDKGITKTMQFEPATQVFDACRIIREKMPDAGMGPAHDYGLFLSDEDPKKGVWMEPGRSLEYYLVRSGDTLEYKKKIRTLKIRMLDGALKTLLVDDSQPVGQLMVTICARIGITNHDEYSLVREHAAKENEKPLTPIPTKKEESKMGTLTLGRSKEKKMEQLRKQLHTDEEVNWVNHAKTLREQGVDESENLLLRRKYFFSDQNIDSRDPVQLNLLYVQCRDAILDGTHPVSYEQALSFGGLQCQIQYGDFSESKHRTGFLDLKEFLPRDYLKVKGAEKKLLGEYRSCRGMNEIDAKVEYTHRCRSLKTYGVTFFLVKEKMPGKNKLVPRLLGINKDCCMRVDEKTKEVMRIWPLEQVRRWAASPNTFTLDFGDYQDCYYSVQTPDGEKIAQLIAGYIDIILKKKKAKDHYGLEGDEGSTMLEDVVEPAKATLISHGMIRQGHAEEANIAMPGVMRSGLNGELPYGTGAMRPQYGALKGQVLATHMPPQGQKPKVYDTMNKAQRALIGTIKAAEEAVTKAEVDLETRAEIPPIGEDRVNAAVEVKNPDTLRFFQAAVKWREERLEVSKQQVQSELAAVDAATAEILQLTAVHDRIDHAAIGAAVNTISSNLPEVTRGVKTIAALLDEEDRGTDLIDATRKMCKAVSDLLCAVSPEKPPPPLPPPEPAPRKSILKGAGSSERSEDEPKQDVMFSLATQIGDLSHAMLTTIEEPTEESKEFQDTLVQLAKAVASCTAHLVHEAKEVCHMTEDKAAEDRVIRSATLCAFATSQLVACARVVAPTIDSPRCQEQLTDAAKQVALAMEQLLRDAEQCAEPSSPHVGNLRDAARQVSEYLSHLLAHIRQPPSKARVTEHEQELETIITTTDKIVTYQGEGTEIVRHAKVVAERATNLMGYIKADAELEDNANNRQQLLDSARILANAVSNVVERAKTCAKSPQEPETQLALKVAAEDLRTATSVAAQKQLHHRTIAKLEEAAKTAAASATQTIQAANVAGPACQNMQTRQQLKIFCEETAEYVPRLISAVKQHQVNLHESFAEIELLRTSEDFLEPSGHLVDAARGAVPTISDHSASMSLSSATQRFSQDLALLRAAVTNASEACGTQELDNAIRLVHSLETELIEYKRIAAQNRLLPLPEQTPQSCAAQLNSASKAVGSNMAQLLSATQQNDEQFIGPSARETAEGLRGLSSAVRGLAACDPAMDRDQLMDAARDLMDKCAQLLRQVKYTTQNRDDPDNRQKLTQVAKAVTYSLNKCVNCLPGQQGIDSAIHSITTYVSSITIERLPPPHRSYEAVQESFVKSSQQFSDVTSRLISSIGGSETEVAKAVEHYMHVFHVFIANGLELAAMTDNMAMKQEMVESLRAMSQQAARLLVTVKSSAADPTDPNIKQQITLAARALTESVNHLIDVCTSGAAWQKECDNAVRTIQTMRPVLDNPIHPVSEASYYDCLDIVSAKSKSLGDAMGGISQFARNSDFDSFAYAIRNIAEAVCGLAESGAHAAYLVGVSDLNSVRGKPGLVDQNKLGRHVDSIRAACEVIRNPYVTEKQVLESANIIANMSSTLATICQEASKKTPQAAAKKHFFNVARDLTNSTTNFIQSVKTLDANFIDANKRLCSDSTVHLLNDVDTLVNFASSREFASLPAKISPEGRATQEPITRHANRLLDGSCDMILTAKTLALNPQNPPTWQSLAEHSKVVSNSIKDLVSEIRNRAPGQSECDKGVEKINEIMHKLDQTSMAASNQLLVARRDKKESAFHEQTTTSAKEIMNRIDNLSRAAKSEAENLGHWVVQMMSYFEPLSDGCVGAASLSHHNRQQTLLLEQCKTVCESQGQLLLAAKDSGGNPKAKECHTVVDDCAGGLKQALVELLGTMSKAVAESGMISSTVEVISKAIAKTGEAPEGEPGSFVECQTKMVKHCREIARIASEMVAKAHSNVNELGGLGMELSRHYDSLAQNSRGAVALTPDPELSFRIKSTVQALGNGCIELSKHAAAVRGSPLDNYAKEDLERSSRLVSERVSYVLAALQAGSKGTQACINAASTVSGIIGDLDTTIMFATAGTLNPPADGDLFSTHRDPILKTAKALVEDTKALVAGAASSQEQLAVAAQNAVRTIIKLSDVVKAGAASLTSQNAEAQVLVINSVKDVAAALANLIQATKNASGKSYNDPAMTHLKEAAKVMVTNVTTLVNTVKTVEDENQRGTKALESAIEAIAQEIRGFDAAESPCNDHVGPEDLIRVSKPLTDATGKAVAASQSCLQEDVIVAANMGRKVVSDLLATCKGCANGAESPDVKFRVMDAGRDVGIRMREVLQALHLVLQKPSNESRQKLIPASKSVAQAVSELVSYAEILKGSDWVNPSDPSVIAEHELLTAKNLIEAASKNLSALKPRPQAREADESLNFDEQILEACKSIATAVQALVLSASASQRELVSQGRVEPSGKVGSEDYQWSEGLVSAARMVAAATHTLCEAANSLVTGHASEEKLISAAKQVAASTAQLLVACKVKSDLNSHAMQRLQSAGNAVKVACDHLVHAARQAIEAEDERTLVINQRMVSGITQVLNAQEEVLRKERELSEARVKLAAIRKAKYKENPAGGSSGTPSHETSPEPPLPEPPSNYYSDF